MATDFAVNFLALPVLIGVLVLLSIAILGRKRGSQGTSFLGLGLGRIALGYLGGLLALLIYSAIDSVILGRTKVALGEITAAEAHKLVLGWTLYLFILLTPFIVISLSAVGLPTIAMLRRMHLASVSGTLIVSQLFASLFALWPAISPSNLWCESHMLQCEGGTYVSASILCATVALGFALGARMPWLRGT